jgi:DNA-binding GntR family transcriptional regulator
MKRSLERSLRSESDHVSVYRRLKEMLIDSHFRPGQPIMINEIADRLRVSATPVREGLIRLRSEGFLDSTPRRGFFAKVPSLKEVVDLHKLISLILIHSIKHLRDVDCGSIESLAPAEQIEGNSNRSASRCVQYLDAVFEDLVCLSRNDAMTNVLRNATERTRYLRTIDLETPERLATTLRLIDELFVALRRRNIAAAVAMLQSDFDNRILRMPLLVKEGISRLYAPRDQLNQGSDLAKPVTSRNVL